MAVDQLQATQMGQHLLEYVSRWWAGEAEVARTFFSRPHPPEEHLRWLRLQAFKELQPRPNGIIIRNVEKLRTEYQDLERGVDRRAYLGTLQFVLEEFRHYVLFADVIDEITGDRLMPEELATYELPEERKLRDVRETAMRQWGELARCASSFCEGGGASIFYEGMQIGGDSLREHIAAACRSVYEDEIDHARHGVQDLVRVARTADDWATAHRLVEAISRQRLRMRNEQFGFPLSEERLEAIAQGKIELPERFQALLV